MNNFKKNRYSPAIAFLSFLLFFFTMSTSVLAQDYLQLPGQEKVDSTELSFLDFDNAVEFDSLEKIWRVEYAIYDSLYRAGYFDPPEKINTPPDTMWQRLEKDLNYLINTQKNGMHDPGFSGRFRDYVYNQGDIKEFSRNIPDSTIYKMYWLAKKHGYKIGADLIWMNVDKKSKFYPVALLEMGKFEKHPYRKNFPKGNLKKLRKLKSRPIQLIEAAYHEMMYYANSYPQSVDTVLAQEKALQVFGSTETIYQLENQIDLLYVIADYFEKLLNLHDIMVEDQNSDTYITWIFFAKELDKYYQATLKSIENYWPEKVDLLDIYRGIKPGSKEELIYLSNDILRFKIISQFENDIEEQLKQYSLQPKNPLPPKIFKTGYYDAATFLDSVVINHIKPFHDQTKRTLYRISDNENYYLNIEPWYNRMSNDRPRSEDYEFMASKIDTMYNKMLSSKETYPNDELLDFILSPTIETIRREAKLKLDLYGDTVYKTGCGKDELEIALEFFKKAPLRRQREYSPKFELKTAEILFDLNDEGSLLEAKESCMEILSVFPNTPYAYRALILLGKIELESRKPDLQKATNLFLQAADYSIYRKDLSALILYCETQLIVGEIETINTVREKIEWELIENSLPDLWHDSERRRLVEILASTFIPPNIETIKNGKKEFENYLKEYSVRDKIFGKEAQIAFVNLLIDEVNDLKNAEKVLKDIRKNEEKEYLDPWIELAEISLNEQKSSDLGKSFCDREKWIERLTYDVEKHDEWHYYTIRQVTDVRLKELVIQQIYINHSIAKHLAIENSDLEWAKRANDLYKYLIKNFVEKSSIASIKLSNWQLKKHFSEEMNYSGGMVNTSWFYLYHDSTSSAQRTVIEMAFENAFTRYELNEENGKKEEKINEVLEDLSRHYLEYYYDDPKADAILYKSGAVCFKNGGEEEALRIFNDLICNYPKSEFVYDAIKGKFFIVLKKRMYNDAIADADSIISSSKYSKEVKQVAKSVLAQALYFQTKDEIGGIEDHAIRQKLLTSIENIDDENLAITILQDLAQSASTPDEAMSCYDLILELYPNSPAASRAVFNKAVILRGQTPVNQSEKDLHGNLAQLFERSTEIDSTSEHSLQFFLNAADEYSKSNNLEKELKLRSSIIRLFPDYAYVKEELYRSIDLAWMLEDVKSLRELAKLIEEGKFPDYLLTKSLTLEGFCVWWNAENPFYGDHYNRSKSLQNTTSELYKEEVKKAIEIFKRAVEVYENSNASDKRYSEYVVDQARLAIQMIEIEKKCRSIWLVKSPFNSIDPEVLTEVVEYRKPIEELAGRGGAVSKRALSVLANLNKRIADHTIVENYISGETSEERISRKFQQSLQSIHTLKKALDILDLSSKLEMLLLEKSDSISEEINNGKLPYDYLGIQSDSLIWNRRISIESSNRNKQFFNADSVNVIMQLSKKYSIYIGEFGRFNYIGEFGRFDFESENVYEELLTRYHYSKDVMYKRLMEVYSEINSLGFNFGKLSVSDLHDLKYVVSNQIINFNGGTGVDIYGMVLEPKLSRYLNSLEADYRENYSEEIQDNILDIIDVEFDLWILANQVALDVIEFVRGIGVEPEMIIEVDYVYIKRILRIDKNYGIRINEAEKNAEKYRILAEQNESTEYQKIQYFFENLVNNYRNIRINYLDSAREVFNTGFESVTLDKYSIDQLLRVYPQTFGPRFGLSLENYFLASDESWLVRTDNKEEIFINVNVLDSNKKRISTDLKSDELHYLKVFDIPGSTSQCTARIKSSHPFRLYINGDLVMAVYEEDFIEDKIYEVDLKNSLVGKKGESRILLKQHSKQENSFIEVELDFEYIKAPTGDEEIIFDD